MLIQEKGGGRPSIADREAARQKDASRVLAILRLVGSATPAELQMHLGFSKLDWFSPHWRAVNTLCKSMGVVSIGSGKHRRYHIGGKT